MRMPRRPTFLKLMSAIQLLTESHANVIPIMKSVWRWVANQFAFKTFSPHCQAFSVAVGNVLVVWEKYSWIPYNQLSEWEKWVDIKNDWPIAQKSPRRCGLSQRAGEYWNVGLCLNRSIYDQVYFRSCELRFFWIVGDFIQNMWILKYDAYIAESG